MKTKQLLTFYLNFKPAVAKVIKNTCERWEANHYKDMLHVSMSGRFRVIE